MFDKTFNAPALAACLFTMIAISSPAVAEVPEPFKGHDPASVFTIQYDDVNAILRHMVVDLGRSDRTVDKPEPPKTGTRMKAQKSRTTAKEGNRFFYEEFNKNEEYAVMLSEVQNSLEAIPDKIPLENFSRKEQLAYWLNLYNITLIDELVKIYPERNLKKELVGKKSILDQKVLTVSGVQLSLNDIQYKILAANYDNDPLIMYGLYQGIIGGPNIRKKAYTAENARRMLQDNAEEFVNSNRGTYTRNGGFEVSSLYERNRQYFPNFEEDLKQHLMRYIEGPERQELQAATRLRADIDDWTIADVYGTVNEIGGSLADSNAAMLDAVVSFQPNGSGGTVTTNFSVASSMLMAKAKPMAEFSPEIMDYFATLKNKEEAANLLREGRVTIEELGTVDDNYNNEAEDDQN